MAKRSAQVAATPLAAGPHKQTYRIAVQHVRPDDRYDVVQADSPDEAFALWLAGRGIRKTKHKPELVLITPPAQAAG